MPFQVLVEVGPFLKHYADFATKFEQININYSEIKRKYPGNDGVIGFLIVFSLRVDAQPLNILFLSVRSSLTDALVATNAHSI